MRVKTHDLARAIEKGQSWLDRNAGTLMAETETGEQFKDNFLELLILEVTGNWRLVDLKIPPKKWNYFGGKPVIIPEPYPDDIDTQAVANTVIKVADTSAHEILDEILAAENEDGIIPLYYDYQARPRVCVETCANICTFFYLYGRGHQVQKSLVLVATMLKERDFAATRYYFAAEMLFFYVSRLVSIARAPELLELENTLQDCIAERIGQEATSLSLAIRVFLCQKFDIPNSVDLQRLLEMQEDDGAFGVGWCFNFGRSKIKIGHRGFTCALAVEAIKLAAAAGNSSTQP